MVLVARRPGRLFPGGGLGRHRGRRGTYPLDADLRRRRRPPRPLRLPRRRPRPPTLIPVDAPAVLQVGCDGTRTTIVAADRPGPAGRRPPRVQQHQRERNWRTAIEDVGGDSVPGRAAARSSNAFAPGTYKVSCAADLVAFEVVDPAGFYTPAACADPGSGRPARATTSRARPGCAGRRIAGGATPAPRARARVTWSNLAATRWRRVLASPTVVVIRQGVVLAVLTLRSRRQGRLAGEHDADLRGGRHHLAS